MRKKRHPVRKFLLFLVFCGLVYGGYYWYYKTEYFHISQVEVIPENKLNPDQALDLIGDSPRYFKYDNKDLEEMINHHPYIKDSQVTKVFPNKMTVIVEERRPVIALYQNNQYLLIDEHLVVVDTVRNPRDYMVVEGFHIGGFFMGDPVESYNNVLLSNIIDLAFYASTEGLPETCKIRVVEDQLVLDIKDNLNVLFGDGERIADRFNRAMGIYVTLVENGEDTGTIVAIHDGQPSLTFYREY